MKQINGKEYLWLHLLKILQFPWSTQSFSQSSLQDSIDQLNIRINKLQQQIEQVQSTLETENFTIEKYIVERMNVESFELNVETIDVEEVSGALNVGITHNSVVHRGRSKKDVIQPHQNKKQQITQQPDVCEYEEKKYTMTFYPNGSIPKKKPKTG